MKALTLYQPWATLVAIQAKRIETRSWKTDYRGPLVIHASKKFSAEAADLCKDSPFFEALFPLFGRVNRDEYGGKDAWIMVENIPTGCILATCRLLNVIEIPDIRRAYPHWGTFYLPPDEPELNFGDYIPGRYAWLLEKVEVLKTTIPCRGSLGLWECDKL